MRGFYYLSEDKELYNLKLNRSREDRKQEVPRSRVTRTPATRGKELGPFGGTSKPQKKHPAWGACGLGIGSLKDIFDKTNHLIFRQVDIQKMLSMNLYYHLSTICMDSFQADRTTLTNTNVCPAF